MKQHLISICLVFILFAACTNDTTTYEVGQDFLENNNRVFKVDTLTLKTATIISDSLITSGASRILIGALQDEDFGNLTAQSYFGLSSLSYYIDNDAVFDSIALVLFYDRYSYGDTTQVQTYKVHQITEIFEPKDDEYYFYNTSTLAYSNDVLGAISFTPFPNKKDSINISLDYNFGKNIFDKIIDDEITDDNDLMQEFRGITIVANKETNNVLGFKYSANQEDTESTAIRLYYTLKEEDDSEYIQHYVDLRLAGEGYIFNNITSNRDATVLSSLSNSEDILYSNNTNNKIYLQSGTGISMRVEMPSLTTLNQLENSGTTLNAVLKIFPDHKSYNDIELIKTLNVYIVDKKNRTVGTLYSTSGSQVFAQLNVEDNEFNSNTYYSVDLSHYVDQILTSSYTLDYALRFEFPDNSETINRLLIYDSESPEDSSFKMELQLTYLSY
jgi:hypothetical protein